tara:strand:- start:281 stop:505 length:225 start_codon:yes stop_codon:yes gene_type:complete
MFMFSHNLEISMVYLLDRFKITSNQKIKFYFQKEHILVNPVHFGRPFDKSFGGDHRLNLDDLKKNNILSQMLQK